jgi:hypothetical protein
MSVGHSTTIGLDIGNQETGYRQIAGLTGGTTYRASSSIETTENLADKPAAISPTGEESVKAFRISRIETDEGKEKRRNR